MSFIIERCTNLHFCLYTFGSGWLKLDAGSTEYHYVSFDCVYFLELLQFSYISNAHYLMLKQSRQNILTVLFCFF